MQVYIGKKHIIYYATFIFQVKNAKPQKGDPPMVHRVDNKLFITWHDKRLVHVLSTVHNGSTFVKKVRSRFHENFIREVDHPRAIQLYTHFMGGVDLADQQTQYSVLLHRMLKWWKKLFICSLLEVSFVNARVIYKDLNPAKRVKPHKFRMAIIEGLVDGYEQTSKPFRRPVNNPSSRLTSRHFVSLNPKMIGGGRRSNPDCEVCSDRAVKRHQTSYFCRDCDKPMCAYPCFMRYHTMQNYKIDCTPNLHK